MQFQERCGFIYTGRSVLLRNRSVGISYRSSRCPNGFRMCLHSFCRADYKHCVIQRLQASFHFWGEIRVAWGIDQSKGASAGRKNSLLCIYGYPPGSFCRVRIQKRIPVIHPSQFSDGGRLYIEVLLLVVFPASTWARIPRTVFSILFLFSIKSILYLRF